jgi:hypothetical protein
VKKEMRKIVVLGIMVLLIGIGISLGEAFLIADCSPMDDPYVRILRPQEGFLYMNDIIMAHCLPGVAIVVFGCSWLINVSPDVDMNKTRYYIDGERVSPEEWGIRSRRHLYKIEVFDDEDNSASDDIEIIGYCFIHSSMVYSRQLHVKPNIKQVL